MTQWRVGGRAADDVPVTRGREENLTLAQSALTPLLAVHRAWPLLVPMTLRLARQHVPTPPSSPATAQHRLQARGLWRTGFQKPCCPRLRPALLPCLRSHPGLTALLALNHVAGGGENMSSGHRLKTPSGGRNMRPG